MDSDQLFCDQGELLDISMSNENFCDKWREVYRPIAIVAQQVLKVIFPQGAKVLQFLIQIADSYCKV